MVHFCHHRFLPLKSVKGLVILLLVWFSFPQNGFAQKLLDVGGPLTGITASSLGVNSSIAVAYSVRQLKTTYDHAAITPPAAVTGFTNSSTPLLRVRRSFDNAQLDIGYDGNGDIDSVLLKNFVTGKVGLAAATNPTANGRVSIWYDQSGNSRDASVGSAVPCPGAATEPFIVSAGVIERNGGGQIGLAGINGGMLGDGGTAFDLAASGYNRYGIQGDRTLNVVSQPRVYSTNGGANDGLGTYLIDRNGGTGAQDPPLTCIKAVGNNWALQIRNDANAFTSSYSGTIPISVNRSDNVTVIRSGDNYPMYINGVLAGTSSMSGNNSMSPLRAGYGCLAGENVYYGEMLLFPTGFSNANQTALNTSQNNYFSIGATPGTWTGATSSDWSVASNWSNNEVPTVLTEVEVPAGTTNPLIITGGQTTFTVKKLTVKLGANLTIDGNLNVSGAVIVNDTIDGTGTLTLNGTFDQTIAGTPSANLANLIIANTTDTVLSTTNLNITGTLTVNTNAIFSVSASSVINSASPAGTITGNGMVLVTRTDPTANFQNQYKFSTYTLTNLTVNFNGSGAQDINLGVNYSNLIVSGTGIKTLTAAVTATNITGNITVNSGTLFTNNFNIGSPTNRTITVAAGAILNAGTSIISFGAGTKQLTINGTFQTENTAGFSGGTTTAVDNTNAPTVTLAATSTIEYNASGTQTITALTTYGNLVLTGGSKTISGTNTLAGNLTINTGATYNGAANPVLNIGGNFTNNGTYTSGTGTVTFNGTGSQAISSVTTPLVFGGAVVFSGASSVATMQVNATVATDLNVNTNKTLNLGLFSFNRATSGGTLTVAGTLRLGNNTGGQTGSNFPLNFTTNTLTGGTVEYNGSNAITQTVFATPTYANLILTNGSGTGNAAKISTGSFTVNTGTMTVNTGVTFTPAIGNVLTGTTAGVLTGTGTIAVTGGVALATQYNFLTLTLTNLSVSYDGASTIAAGTYANLNITTGTSTLGAGTINVTGSITISSGATLAAGTSTLNVGGNWTNNGTYTTGVATVTFNGTTSQTISGSSATSFSSLTVSNTTAALIVSTNTNITGTLTINASASITPDATVVFNNSAAAGTITGNGTARVTRTTATADYANQYKFTTNTLTNLTIDYAGAGNQTITIGGAGVNYGNLAVSGSGTKTLSAAISATNLTGANINVNAATLATGNFNIVCPATHTITIAAGATMDAGTSTITFGATTKQMTINGTFQTANLNGFSGTASTAITNTNTPTITLGAASVIEYTASAAQVVTNAVTYANNLVLSNGSKTIAAGTLTVSDSLVINSGATYLGTTNNPIFNLAGNFVNNGTFTQGTGLMTLNGTTQTIGGSTTPTTFADITINSSTNATLLVNATSSGNLNIASTRVLDLGVFSFNRTVAGGTLTVAGTMRLGAASGGQTGSNFPLNYTTMTLTGGTVVYNGSNAITQTVFATPTYNNLTLTNGSGSGTANKVSTASFVVNTGSFTVNSLAAFNPAAANIISGSGTLTGTGTIYVSGTDLATQYTITTKVTTNLTIIYSGANQTIAAGTYSALNITGTGTKTLGGAVIVTGNVDIATGSDILSTGANQLNVRGNWTNNGTFTAGSGTVIFDGTVGQVIGGTQVTSFNNLTISNISAAVNVSTNVNVSGTFSMNGAATLLVPDATVVFNNSAAAGIISGTGTIRVTRIAATADYVNQYKFTTNTLTSITVEYAGAGAQTINNTVGTYGALTVSGSGTKTLQGSVTITNNVTMSSGTFATGGFNLTTSGNWVNNGVTLSGGGNINLNSTSGTISGTTSTSFPGIVIGAGAVYTMNNNNTCTGLTFTAGGTASSFTHGTNNNLTVNGNVSIPQPTASVICSWNINNATVSVTGSLAMGGSDATAGRVSQIALTTGALTVNGNTTLTGALAANTVINLNSGGGNGASTLTFGGTVTLTTLATLTPGTGSTVTYNGTLAQTIPVSTTFLYNNINSANSNSSGATLGAAISATNVTGNLTVVSGILNTNNLALVLAASRTLTVSTGATLNAGTTSITFGTTGTATINGTLKTTLAVGFSGAAGTAISSTNTPTVTLGGSSTVEYDLTTGGQTVTVAQTYNNLRHNNTSGTNTAGGNVVVNGRLTTTAGGTFALTTSTLTGTLSSITNPGTITTTNTSATPIPTGKNWGAGTVNYNATTGAQTIMAGTYTTLTFGNTSGTQTASGAITATTVNNNTNAADILNMVTFTLSATTINNTGTIRTQNTSATPLPSGLTIAGTVTYDATTGAQTIMANTYTTLTMGNTSGTQTAVGNITTTTLNNNTAGIVLNMATFTLAATTITNNATATIQTQNTSATPLPTGLTIAGTVNYNATAGGQTVRANTYTTLTLGNTSGTQTADGNITATTVNNNTNAASILNLATFRIITATGINNTGTIRTQHTSTATPFPAGLTIGGTVNYDASGGGQTIQALTFTNLTISNTSGTNTLANGGTINIAGVFTPSNQTFTITGNTINFSGTGPQTVPAFNYQILTVGARSNAGVIVTLSGVIGLAGDPTFNATATYDVTGNTINYNGAAQTVSTTFSYNNLTYSGSLAKTGGATVNGILSLEGTATAGTVITYGASATLQYNGRGTYSATTNEWPATFSGEGGVIINGASTITLAAQKVITFALTINTGAVANLSTFTTHTSNGLFLNGASQISGTHGGTTSGATTINSTFFATATGRITVTSPTKTWVTSGTTSWNTAGNWNPSGVPTGTSDVVIPSGGTQPSIDVAATCRNLTINLGATLSYTSGSLDIAGDLSNSGTFNNACPITISGTTVQNFNGFTTSAAITVSKTAGTININGAVSAASLTFSASGSTLSVSGSNTLTLTGALTLNNAAAANVIVSLAGTGTISCGSVQIGNNTAPTGNTTTFTHTLSSTLSNFTISGNLNINSYFLITARIRNGVFIHNSGIVSVGGTLATVNVNNDATVTMTYTMGSSSPQLNLSGATPFTVAGTGTSTITLNGTGAIVNYNGTLAQTARATTYTTFKSNNTAGVTLAGASTIATLTIGDVTASSIFNDGGFVITPGASPVLNLTQGTYNLGSAGTATTWPAWSTTNISAGTTVAYVSGASQTVSTAPTYQNLTFTGAGAKSIASGTLSVAGNWSTTGGDATFITPAGATVTGNIAGSGNIIAGAATVIALAGNWTNNGTFTKSTGTVDYNGTGAQSIAALSYHNLTVSGTRVGSPVLTLPSGTMSVSGTFTNTTTGLGSTTVTGNTIDYNGTGAQTIAPFNYNNLTISGARSSAAITLASGSINIAGAFSVTATAIGSYATTGNTVNFSATAGSQTVPAFVYNNLTMSNTSGTNTAAGNIIVDGTLTTTAGGTLSLGSSLLTGLLTTITHNGIITTSNLGLTPFSSGRTWGGSGTIQYGVTSGSQTIMSGTYFNLTLSNTSGTNSPSGNILVNGTLTTSAGGTFALGTNTLLGNPTAVVNDGIISTANTSATPLAGSETWGGTGQVIYASTTGGQTIAAGNYTNLTISNTSGTVTLGGNVTVSGTLTTTSGGILDLGSTNTLTGTLGSIVNNGTIRTSVPTATSSTPLASGKTWNGTIVYNLASGAQTIVNGTYNNLTINNTSGTNTLTGGNLIVNGNFTANGGGSLDLGTNTLSGTLTTITNTGTILTQNTSATPIPTGIAWTGTINYNAASGGQTIAAASFNNLTIGNASGSQVMGANLVVNGTLTTTAGGTLDLVGNTLSGTLATITNNGIIATQSASAALPAGRTWGGTISYNNTSGGQTIVSATSYNNLTLGNTSGSQTPAANLVVNGTLTTTVGGTLNLSTFTLSGTLGTITNNGTISTAVPTATSAAPIPASRTWGGTIVYALTTGLQTVVAGTYNNLTLSNTSGNNATGGNLVVDGTLSTSTGGTLLLTTNTLTGTLATITNNGTINTANTSATPLASGKTWGGAGRVFYSSTAVAQTLVAGTFNCNLEVRNSGANVINTLGGNITTNGDFKFSSQALAIGGNTFTINGTVTSHTSSGCFRGSNTSNLVIGGSGTFPTLFFDQSTPGTTNRLNNFTYNRSAQTITLGDTLSIKGFVTPTAGTLATGNRLKLISDATGDAGILNGSGSYISGTVTVERFVPSSTRNWRFMSSAVSGSTLADWQNEIYITGSGGATNGFDATLSNQAGVYRYQEDTITGNLNSGWTAASNITNTLTVGRGYRVFVRGDRTPGRLDGTITTQNAVTINSVNAVNSGNINMNPTFSSSGTPANDGWNLLGNPYPCAIDWNAFHDAGRTGTNPNYSGTDYANLNPTVYILDAGGNTYSSFNAFSGANVGDLSNGIIPSGAAFWVKAEAASPAMTMKEIYKTSTAPGMLFKTGSTQFKLRLTANEFSYDEAAFKYVNEATKGKDAYDIDKLYGANVNIASIGSDGSFLSANYQPLIGVNDTIKLSVGIANSGSYTLEGIDPDNLTNLPIHLMDYYTNTVVDLRKQSKYNFSVDISNAATKGNERFALIVGDIGTPIPVVEIPITEKKIIAYPTLFSDQVTLQKSFTDESTVNITITDVSGKLLRNLLKQEWNGNSIQLNLQDLASGTYFIQCESSNFARTLKVTKK